MLAVFLTHHYLTLLDLSKMAIEKHMLSRSQSQLYDFINQSTEPTIVLEWVEKEFQFVMSNKKADRLLKIDPEGNNANNRLNQKIVQMVTADSLDEMGINDSEKSMNTGSTDEYKSLYECLLGDQTGTGSIHDLVAKVNTPKLDDTKQIDDETISTEKENIIQFAI